MKKVYIVTGAGHFPGIGSGIAQALVNNQNQVIVSGRNFDAAWVELSQQNPDVLLITGDIRDKQTQHNIIDTAIDTWGRINGIIHNASPSDDAIYEEGLLSRITWNDVLQTNLIAVYELSMLAHKHLLATQGSMVCIGSRAGLQAGIGNNIAYGTAKAALHHLTQELALLLAPVRVNAVSPGLVNTQRLGNQLQDRLDTRLTHWREISLTGELITPEDIADSIMHLLGSKNITGQILSVCSGVSIQPPFIPLKPKQ